MMNSININDAKQNLFQLISDVNKEFNPIKIISDKGGNAVLLSENDWRDIEETICLSSIPGYVESVKEARKTNSDECTIYRKGEKW